MKVEGSPSEGLVLEPAEDLAEWSDVEDELAAAFRLTQEASAAGAPVVYLVKTRNALGRGDPKASAVASALCSGVRALSFEGRAKGRTAVAIAISQDAPAEQVRAAIELGLSGALTGQVVAVGEEHVGALLP